MEKPLPSAQVYSENIVGYQTLGLPAGYQMVTSTFVPTLSTGESLRLGDIVPVNFSGATGDLVQFFNLNGTAAIETRATYYEGYGWFDFDTNEPIDNKTIPVGTGMFVYSSQENAEFVVAGEVKLDPIELPIASGYTVVGNSSPVPITLEDVIPSNFSGANGDLIQFFNSNGDGTVLTRATYYEGYGWFDFDTNAPLDSAVLNPGDAFFVYATDGSAMFAFPGIDVTN